MTNHERTRHGPGSGFLRVAHLVFSADTVTSVFVPAIADFREELAAADRRWFRRTLLQWRWRWSLALLFVVVPFVVPMAREQRPLAPGLGRRGGWLLFALFMALYGGTWRFFGWFVAAATLSGAALACALRAWHSRHPASLEDHDRTEQPKINLSSIHVGGDIAGLMFAAGSVAIVLVGLPGVWWFFVAAMSIASLVAWSRFVWMRDFSHRHLNSISDR